MYRHWLYMSQLLMYGHGSILIDLSWWMQVNCYRSDSRSHSLSSVHMLKLAVRIAYCSMHSADLYMNSADLYMSSAGLNTSSVGWNNYYLLDLNMLTVLK